MLQVIVDYFVFSVLRFNPETQIGKSLDFFIYDSIKILTLLFLMIWVVGVLRTFLPQEKVKKWLNGNKVFAHFFAVVFGAITPFCSCSSIPIFIGFINSGIPLGVAFSFLITSPIINEYLVVLMIGFFGWKITILYVASGMILGFFIGWILGLFSLERFLVKDMVVNSNGQQDANYNFRERVVFGRNESAFILRKLWLWILLGVALGSVIHNYIPEKWVQLVISKTGFFSVPLAVLLGVPMYANCAAIVPVAVALFQKGIPLGTALAFMMSTAALSLPEAIMLRRVMKLQLIALFFGLTTVSIMIIGYLFNLKIF